VHAHLGYFYLKFADDAFFDVLMLIGFDSGQPALGNLCLWG
jgi:hypothetical protein